ncbi:serine hydrolase domain-containing protein [Flavobacterium rhizosphaerae]|uniref:Serine hydrolase domain-containing protein n=1 Tax=Flavobacterium rhizosphaerae TaxID=3163298 RepID=A0ABW8Z104_9FLAO
MKNAVLTILLMLYATIGLAQTFNSQKIDSLFLLLQKKDKFMGSIAISQNQNTIYQNTIGFTDIENGIKATGDSKYRIGSISKMFTASLVFKAIDDKKLKLDQTITAFFPNIKNSGTITIGNLLNHSSGIHDFTRDDDYLEWNTRPQSKEKMIERIENGGSDFMPNVKSEYSNSNYVLLTFILERIYNQPFSKILTNNIINPLKLTNTYLGGNTNPEKNESYSYKYEGKWKRQVETDMSIPQGAGAIISNPEDLNIFAGQLFSGNIVSEKSLELMKTINNGYGMGLFQFPYNDKISYGHTGSIDGFESVSCYFPKDKLAIALTSNGVNYDNNKILLAVLATYFKEPYTLPAFNRIELKSDELEKYLGTYSSKEIPPKITITKQENTLFAQASGQGAFPLEPTAENVFTFDQTGVKIVFNPSEKTMILYQGGGEFRFKAE